MMNGLHVRKFNQFLKSTHSLTQWSKIKPNNYDKLRICIPIRHYSNYPKYYFVRKYNNNIGYIHYTSILFAQRQFCSSINNPNNPNSPKNSNNENTANNNNNNNNSNNNNNQNNNHMSQNNHNSNNYNYNNNNNHHSNNNNNNNGHDGNAIPMIGALPANFPHMQKLFRKWQRKLTFTVLSIIISVVGLVYYFWDNNPYFNIRPYISSPLSQVATDAISTQDLQRQAVITSKNLLNDLFKDKTVRRDTSDFFITVLNDEILFENLIRILKSLITQDTIVSSFKELVLTVINDEKVFNELVNLISNAITHPKNKQLLVDTISEILENKTVRKNAAIMTSDTINEVLNDEQVKIIAIEWLQNVLKDETIQESTSNTLYKVVVGAITPKVFHKKKHDKTSTASPSSSTTTTRQEPLESFTETPKNEQEIIESGKEESNNKDIPLKYEHGNVHGEIIEIPKSKIHENVDSESESENIDGKEENENDDTSEESLIKKIDDQTSNF